MATGSATFEIKLSIGAASLWRTMGYALNRAWIYALFFSTVLYQPLPETARADVFNAVYLLSICCLTFGLAVCALKFRATQLLLERKIGAFVGPTIAGIGIIAMAPSLAAGAIPSTVQSCAGAVATGLGSALVLLDLGRSYATTSGKMCALEILGATAAATLLATSFFFLPYSVTTIIVIALPFLAELCTRNALSTKTEANDTSPSAESLPKRLLVRFALLALITGSATGLLRDVYSFHGANGFDLTYGAIFALMTCVAVAILVGVILAHRSFSIDVLYKPVVLLCIIGFAVSSIWGPESMLPYAIVTLGYTLFEILAWVVLSEIASRFQYTSIQAFGFGRAIMLAVGIIAGGAFSQFSMPFSDASNTIVVFSAIAVSLLAFARLYVVSEREISQFESDLESTLGESATNRAPSHDAVRASDMEAGSAGRAGNPSASGTIGPTKAQGKSAAAAEGGASGQPSPTASSPIRKIPLLARCRIIGEYYGLSKREIDVFHLLACGRNAARIQEQLMISAGTVNTHTRHIYQKLGVHAQQELIDLMQEADLDAMEQEIHTRKTA